MADLTDISKAIRKAVTHPLESVICALLIAMTVVVFSQVIARYVFEQSLSWSEELARFILMWLSMLSAAYAFKIKSHFALRILVSRFPAKLQWATGIAVHIVVAAFFAVLLYYSIVFVHGVAGHTAPTLQISMQIPYASIIAGSALMLLEALKAIWHEVSGARGTGEGS